MLKTGFSQVMEPIKGVFSPGLVRRGSRVLKRNGFLSALHKFYDEEQVSSECDDQKRKRNSWNIILSCLIREGVPLIYATKANYILQQKKRKQELANLSLEQIQTFSQ